MSKPSADAKHVEAHPGAADDDLFGDVEFEQASPAINASLRSELDDATAAVDGRSPAAPLPRHAGEQVASSISTPVVDAHVGATSATADATTPSQPIDQLATPTSAYSPGKVGRGELTAWVLCAVALINIGIGIGSLTSSSSDGEATNSTHAVDPATAATASLADPSAAFDDIAHQATPSDAKPEGYRTLDLARARLDRGEWERARTMLYSQLAVVDGISEPARSDIEARADFLIAESYRMQAAALASTSKEQDK